MKEKSIDGYVIYADDQGYWINNKKGYAYNPETACQYTADETKKILGSLKEGRKEKAYLVESQWYVVQQNAYLKRKMIVIQNAMEGMTSDQLIRIIPELIFKRRKMNDEF